jgi:hypothetical protein
MQCFGENSVSLLSPSVKGWGGEASGAGLGLSAGGELGGSRCLKPEGLGPEPLAGGVGKTLSFWLGYFQHSKEIRCLVGSTWHASVILCCGPLL